MVSVEIENIGLEKSVVVSSNKIHIHITLADPTTYPWWVAEKNVLIGTSLRWNKGKCNDKNRKRFALIEFSHFKNNKSQLDKWEPTNYIYSNQWINDEMCSGYAGIYLQAKSV